MCKAAIHQTLRTFCHVNVKFFSLALWEAQRLVVFEDRILTKMFVSDEEKMTGDWTKLQNGRLRDLYISTFVHLYTVTVLFGWVSKSRKINRLDLQHVWRRGKRFTWF